MLTHSAQVFVIKARALMLARLTRFARQTCHYAHAMRVWRLSKA